MSKSSGLYCRVRNGFNRIKAVFYKNKLHFYICFACIIVGFILAAAKDYSDFDKSANFIMAIVNGEFKPFADIVRIGFYTTLAFLAIFLAGLNFWLFIFAGYGGLVIGTYLIWRAIFVAFAADAFWGLIYFLLFMLPVFLFGALMYMLALAKVYEISGYRNSKKCAVGLRCQSKLVFEVIKKYWLYSLVFNYTLWLILMLIFIIIF